MPKKYSTNTTLVIVESPAKCKKIEEYLGPGYKCVATYGHLRELSSLKNIDLKNNFTPTYTISDNAIKQKQIEFLRKEIKNANEVILSSDLDREGEAISYSIIELFKLPMDTKRITFNEITESAIQTAIKNPRTIDMNIVNAQQARQIVDVLVGFKVSPMLWKFISSPKGKEHSLSAGRCQTPALKLIYDNQKDINDHVERKVYNTTGYFTNSNIVFELNKQFETDDEITDFLDGSADFSHIYTCSQPVKIFKQQPEPFTTSKLQQVASNELHYAPKETMRLCQSLYECGFITYMRTDSKIYSNDFIDSTKKYIITNYDAKYINENINCMNTGVSLVKDNVKKKQSTTDKPPPQEAHEAIRPTDISLFELPEGLDNKERRMYKLIWENTLESCMAAASFYSVKATITAFQNTNFGYSSELIDFPGWKIVKKKYSTDNKEYQYLQTIKQTSIIPYKKICSKVTIKGLKQHYTEARLIQLLEEKGIGRPSTFSSLVDKTQERGYVKKEDVKGRELSCTDFELENGEMFEIETKREFGNEKGKLVIQPLGMIVIDFLDKQFAGLFNYEYTKLMEDELDKIAKGDITWFNLCEACNNQIDLLIDGLKDESKIEIKLDENNIYIVGKYGPVVKFTETINGKEEIKFKPIKKDIDLHKIENGEYTVEDIVETIKPVKSQYSLGQHHGNDVILKKGKFGIYISWGENSKNLKELGNRPIENITFEEIKKYLDDGNKNIREITSDMTIRKGPKGDYIFYKTTKMKKPKFFDLKNFNSDIKEDYKICDINILRSWIREKYNV
jgi:DNA topoisomerase-1